jgi:hypothetical protein
LPSDTRTGPPPEPFWITVVVAILRFAPGAMLGAAFGFREAASWKIEDPLYFFLIVTVSATVAGLVSGKLGLVFWEGLRKWWW